MLAEACSLNHLLININNTYIVVLLTVITVPINRHATEACAVYADCTVCSCRHSKSSAWVRNMYYVCVCVCVRSANMLKNDKPERNLTALNLLVEL
jgi:hypothetical protein